MHLEEKLYLIELLIPHIDAFSANMYIRTISVLLNFSKDGEEVSPFGNMKYTERKGM